MPFPTIEKLKAQCRIDDDNSAEDHLLTTYALAAKKRAENYINRTLYDENIPETDPDGLLISDDIELALCLRWVTFMKVGKRQQCRLASKHYLSLIASLIFR